MDLDTIAAKYQRNQALKAAEPLRGAATKRSVQVLEQLFSGLKARPITRHRRPTIHLRSVAILRFRSEDPVLILDDPRGSTKEYRFEAGTTVTCTRRGASTEVVFVSPNKQTLTLSRIVSKRKGDLPVTWKVTASSGWVAPSGRSARSVGKGHGPGWGDPKLS